MRTNFTPELSDLVFVRALVRRGPLVYKAVEDGDGTARVLVSPVAPTPEALAALAALARCMSSIASPCVPAVLCDAGPEGLLLDCDAVTDLGTVLAGIELGSIPMSAAEAFVTFLLNALIAAHGVPPEQGGPICIGAFAMTNVLVGPTGKTWLVGFGEPPPPGAGFYAPSVAIGTPPTPSSDIYGTLLFVRSLLPYGLPIPRLQNVFNESSGPEDAVALAMHQMANQRIFAAGQQLGDLADLAQQLDVWRELLDIRPDPDELRKRLVVRVREILSTSVLEVGEGASWFSLNGGERVEIEGRQSLRAIFTLLFETSLRKPGTPVLVEDLIGAGWPGEAPRDDSGANRVHVALSTLRSLGLRQAIVRRGGGYCLDPSLDIRHFATGAEARRTR